MPTPDYINWPTHGPYFNNKHPLARGCKLAMFFNPNWGMGLKALDLSPHANHGTLTNMVPSSDWTPRGIDLDGTDDFVDLGEPPVLDAIANGTMLVAFTPRALANDKRIFSKDATGLNGDIVLWADSGGDDKVYFNIEPAGGAQSIASNAALTVGSLYDVAALWGTPGMRMCVNGILQADVNAHTGSYTSPGNNWRIGNRNGTNLCFNGLVGRVLLYNRRLHYAEIAELAADPLLLFRRRRTWVSFASAAAAAMLLLSGANKRGNKRTFGDRKQ